MRPGRPAACGSAVLDVKGAFDHVNPRGLVSRLVEFGLDEDSRSLTSQLREVSGKLLDLQKVFRKRFLSTYKREKLNRAEDRGYMEIRTATKLVHSGDAVFDAK